MRPLAAAADKRLRPSFLRMTPARKPRTECCCHPVACTIASMVAPLGARSIAMIRVCLLPARRVCCVEDWCCCPTADRVPALSFAVLRATVRAALLRPSVLLLFGRAEVWRFDFGVDIGISSSIERRPSPPPPKPHLGHRAGGAGSRSATSARNWTQYRSVCAQKPVLSG